MSTDRRNLLEYARGRVVEELAEETGKGVAPLVKALIDVTRELESLPTTKESTVDDLAKRRASRRAEAAG